VKSIETSTLHVSAWEECHSCCTRKSIFAAQDSPAQAQALPENQRLATQSGPDHHTPTKLSSPDARAPMIMVSERSKRYEGTRQLKRKHMVDVADYNNTAMSHDSSHGRTLPRMAILAWIHGNTCALTLLVRSGTISNISLKEKPFPQRTFCRKQPKNFPGPRF
jgi:hypothetical protein